MERKGKKEERKWGEGSGGKQPPRMPYMKTLGLQKIMPFISTKKYNLGAAHRGLLSWAPGGEALSAEVSRAPEK